MEEPDGRMDGSSVAVVQSDVCCQGKTQSRPPNDEGVTHDDFDSIVRIRNQDHMLFALQSFAKRLVLGCENSKTVS